eukprot:scaffold5944_cov101-Amphora_coffeaeformis.AAC.8
MSDPKQTHQRIFISAVRSPERTSSDQRAVVIFLHGWAQNAHVFRNRTQKLTKQFLRQGIDCLFLDAPMHLPPLKNNHHQHHPDNDDGLITNTKGREGARAWFYYNATDPTDRSLSQSGQDLHYVGLETSLQLLHDELEQLPASSSTNVTLLGFSQGAVLCHVVAALQEQQTTTTTTTTTEHSWTRRIQNCILVGGFPATPSNWQKTGNESSSLRLDNLTRMRSLHVMGDTRHECSIPSRPKIGRLLCQQQSSSSGVETSQGTRCSSTSKRMSSNGKFHFTKKKKVDDPWFGMNKAQMRSVGLRNHTLDSAPGTLWDALCTKGGRFLGKHSNAW